MRNLDLLDNSLQYIERHICEDIRADDIAAECHCSKSTLEKLFKRVNNISIHEYVVRRRMMLAAKRISERRDETILSVALDYGYSSNESFTRAFKEVWDCNPKEFRNKKFVELFPRIKRPISEGDAYIMERKNVDISQLYDVFKERRECWFVCCDIKSLIPINEISRKAGDLAILEALRRMEEAAGSEDMLFRIGGDEFCMLTDSEDIAYAKKVAAEIESHNGETFSYDGREIPLAMYITVTKFGGGCLRYDELFANLHTALKESKA